MNETQLFFIPLGGTEGSPRTIGLIYGPYEDKTAVVTAIAELFPGIKCDYLLLGGEVLSFDPYQLPLPTSSPVKVLPVEKSKAASGARSGQECETCQTELVYIATPSPLCIDGDMPLPRKGLYCPCCQVFV